MKHDYSNINDIIKNSLSYAEVLRKLNIKPAGGNYATLKQAIQKYQYDTSHFTGQAWNQGTNYKQVKPAISLDQVLVKGRPTNSHKLKLRLIKNGIKFHKCEICNLTEWNNQPIPLELDHEDGDKINNELSNLRLLCPNCHAQTSTYRGKNINRLVRAQYAKNFSSVV